MQDEEQRGGSDAQTRRSAAQRLQGRRERDLHVEYAGGGVVDPAVDYSGAHVVHTRVVVVLDPLGHLRELPAEF